MKKTIVFLAIAIAFVNLSACGNQANNNKSKGDSTATALPPPTDNSSATNPSMADTAYSKNMADTLKDSSKRHH